MTNPADKLRAIVEAKFFARFQGETASMGTITAATQVPNILAQTLLAVLAECDAIGGNIGSIRDIINTHMTEMGE